MSTMATTETTLSGERADLFQALANARHFLRFTVRGLSDSQAAQRTTDSELTPGGLIKHVTAVEKQWQEFIVKGRAAMAWDGADFSKMPPEAMEAFQNEFRMSPEESLDELLENYARVAARTDDLLAEVDMDTVHELPQAPWFVDTHWTVRRTLLHIIAETTQHAGHADIIRESLDGQKTMG
ncbi:DinB family protein [Glutamicibacter sp. AOP12-B1-11]|uniref:DinB family protein n=1 Tax=Micrococcaceae TaxID=1268 RepID=UPI001C612CD5|nr:MULTISPECIES: DinB family protein [unclassified Arthrobacter]